MGKIKKLEAIRGFCAIYVVLHHIFFHYPNAAYKLAAPYLDLYFFFSFGGDAVFVFFCLSGFVIYYSRQNNLSQSFKLYFINRFKRIYIPLILIFIITPIIFFLQKEIIPNCSLKSFLGTILMLQDLEAPSTFTTPLFNNNSLWSLSYEWWYYMFFFFISSYLTYKGQRKLVYILITLFTIIIPMINNDYIFKYPHFFLFWWWGCEIASIYIQNKQISFNNLKVPFIFTLSIVLIKIFYSIIRLTIEGDANLLTNIVLAIKYNPYAERLVFFLCLLSIGILWKKYNWTLFDKTLGLFTKSAKISYTLYIAHYPFIIQAKYLNNFISNWYLQLIIYIIICCIFCYLIEIILYPKLSKKFTQIFT